MVASPVTWHALLSSVLHSVENKNHKSLIGQENPEKVKKDME